MPKKCSCKKLIGGAETKTRFINGTRYNIDCMWITASNSKRWDYEVELDNSVSPGNALEIYIDMAEINYTTFDVLIYDKTYDEYHEYHEFDEDDLEYEWKLRGEESEQGNHGDNPEYTGGSSKKSQSNRKERLRPKLKKLN